jgi:hypothetical protein
MRENISEIEFQVALMIGYYTIAEHIDDLVFYMPTQTEENRIYAADWFIKNCKGTDLFLQFKASEKAGVHKINSRKQLKDVYQNDRPTLFDEQPNEVFRFEIRKNKNFHQHNMLFDKLQEKNSLSLYVAPIFTSRIELMNNLKEWLKGKGYKNNYFYRFINNGAISSNLIQHEKFSFFDDVIYIKPHERINDKGPHHYCFNKKREVSFHSEAEYVKNNGYNFREVVNLLREKISENNQQTILEATDSIFETIQVYIKENELDTFRDFQIDKHFGETAKSDDNILSAIETLKLNQKHSEYVFTVNSLLEELFKIKRVFVYNKF